MQTTTLAPSLARSGDGAEAAVAAGGARSTRAEHAKRETGAIERTRRAKR